MRDVDYIKLGQRVRQYRTAARMTQQQVAEAVDIESSNLSHIERGTIKTSISTLTKIANTLGVTLDLLVCDSLDHAIEPYNQELTKVLEDCTAKELRLITETIKTLKQELRTEN